jgi:hypothetical protein
MYIAAWVDRPQSVTYKDANGSTYTREGGSRSWRNFNPGNISKGTFAESCGSIGGDTRFAIFPNEDTGLESIISLFKSRAYSSLSLKDGIFRYAPPDENDSQAYLDAVSSKIGCAPTKIINTFSKSQYSALAESIKTHEGWKVGQESDGGPLVRAMATAAQSTEVAGRAFTRIANLTNSDSLPDFTESGAPSDKQCIPKLIELGDDVESLHKIQDIAAKSMKAAGYGYTMHNACAATLSAFLNEAGIPIPTTLGAGRLAQRLAGRDWVKMPIGQQKPGDVGVAQNDVHIYLVVETNGPDQMTIADNQAPTPHVRFATGKGKTPTSYFLTAPDDQVRFRTVAFLESANEDTGFYPASDESTADLKESATA